MTDLAVPEQGPTRPKLTQSGLGLGNRWQRMSLATRYAFASGLVLTLAAAIIGSLVTARIEDAVVRNSANATAIYMESMISPISQQFRDSDTLSPGAKRALEELFQNTSLGETVVSYKFWRRDGLLIEASNRDLVGQTFEVTENLLRAWDGEVRADFEELGSAEDIDEGALSLPLLEVYSPIREVWSGDVIAVAEFYVVNYELRDDLIAARRGAWGAVFGIMLALGSLLYAIVLGGSRLIESQRRDLAARMADLHELSQHNTELRLRVQAAAARAAAQTEQTMRRIGADLHDGPAQYLAYAALRLDNLRDKLAPGDAELDTVATAVNDAMTELRALSRGLSLPDIAGRPIAAIVQAVAEAHGVRSGHTVALDLRCGSDPDLSPAARICVFRFMQEGLGNASRHADGIGISVTLTCKSGELRLCLRDHGPGLPAVPEPAEEGHGLGLAGLRDRVESLGGIFSGRTHPDGGTELIMTIETGPQS